MSERDTRDGTVTRDDDATRDDTVRVERNPAERGKWISAAIALLGLWMLVQAYAFDLIPANFWNDVVVGAMLVAVGGYNYFRRADDRVASVGAAVLAALLGLWLVVAPWVYGMDTGTTEVANDMGFWNDIVVGLLALLLGAYSAYEAREMRTGAPAER